MDKGYLILQNGLVLTGERFGAAGDAAAELVFTTGMTGYLETLSDPSYCGQIVVQTFPHIGDCGVISADFESAAPALAGYVVRDLCELPSNFRCEGTLGGFLKTAGVPGLCGVDTRLLTRTLREKGVMNAALVGELPRDLAGFCTGLAAQKTAGGVAKVTCRKPYVLGEGKTTVVLWDFGCKKSLGEQLVRRGLRVLVLPAGSTAAEILAAKPAGVLLSNGPGDPEDCGSIVREIAQVAASGVSLFGICLGHQLLALARGARTEKLKYGHRGVNQPVRETATGRLFVTAQNHGYAVCGDSLPRSAAVSYVNLNDGTCEGIDYADIPAFSVQFHPEACGGPRDTEFLFGRFVQSMGGGGYAAR